MRPVTVARCALSLFAVLLPAASWGQTTGTPVNRDASPPLDLVHHLERLAAGKPVPIVAVAPSIHPDKKAPVTDTGGADLKSALQVIGEAFSDLENPNIPAVLREAAEDRRKVTIPFQFPQASGIWTLASDRTWDISTADSPGDIFALDSRTLFGVFCRSLDEDQLSKSTTAGLRWDDLSAIQQRLLKAVFNHPYALYRGNRKSTATMRYEASSITPLPIEQGTLRLYSAFETIFLPILKAPYDTDLYFLQEDGLQVQLASRSRASYGMPTQVDPKQKPGDLDFQSIALDPPIGLSGVHPLKAIIEAAASGTRLRLTVDAGFADRPAFVGSAALRTGDVLRVLAFGLQGAWRKVGETYLLTWDRRGVASVRLLLEDSRPDSSATTASLEELKARTAVEGWDDLARQVLRPDPEMPLGPTSDQIDRIMRPLLDGDPNDPVAGKAMTDDFNARTAFTTLEPAQQNAVHHLMTGRRTRKTEMSLHSDELITEEMLQQGYLFSHGIRPLLDLPGHAPINLWWVTGTKINTFTAPSEEWNERREAKEAAKVIDPPTGPPVLTSEVRAVAPPALSLAEWTRLIAQMRRKGLNTLYLPVLWDGQTPFASRFFPAYPTAHDKDLLAAVLTMAKAEGITTIGVVHSLAWRFPGSKVHWLTKHPEWVDVDAAGRTRLEWLKNHPNPETQIDLTAEARDLVASDPLILSDCVRPAEPEVKVRQLGLIDELRRYRDLDGVALAHWSRLSGPGYNRYFTRMEAAPALGYNLADRIDYLKNERRDPIDLNDGFSGVFVPGPHALDQDFDEEKPLLPWNAFRFAQDAELANSLISEMMKTWPGRVQLFSDFKGMKEGKVPKADITVRSREPATGDTRSYRRVPARAVTIEAPKHSIFESPTGPIRSSTDPAPRLEAFRADLAVACIGSSRGLVLDFTGAPDLLWDGLALLENAAPDE